MESIINKVKKAQEDTENLIVILNDFKPLIQKYARKLDYEDAFFDMQSLFIEMILKITTDNFPPNEDKYILSYIAKGTYNIFLQCLAQSKYLHYENVNSEINDCQLEKIESRYSCEDTYDQLLFEDLKSILTKREYQVIYAYFMEGKSIQQISHDMEISRQAVSAKKRNAINKIKKIF